MAGVHIGPAGIPITLRQRKRNAGTMDAVRYVREIGLNAMEVEFVQGVRMSIEAAEEVGKIAEEAGVRLSSHAHTSLIYAAMRRAKLMLAYPG